MYLITNIILIGLNPVKWMPHLGPRNRQPLLQLGRC